MKKIKLPFVSRKKYETSQNNLKVLNDSKMQLSRKYIEVQQDYAVLQDINKDLGNELEKISIALQNTKKELSNMKRLLTKNGIEYKKVKK